MYWSNTLRQGPSYARRRRLWVKATLRRPFSQTAFSRKFFHL